MSTILGLLRDISNAASAVGELIGYLTSFIRALVMPRGRIAARLLAAESQLAVQKRRIEEKKDPKPRFTPAFRMLWVWLSLACGQWQDWVHLMQPATVKRWHTTAFRVYWRWKSRSRPGRPPVPREMQALIRRLSRENPLWSPERIRDTLMLLGFDPLHEDTIRKYMAKPKNPRDRSTTCEQRHDN